jgi:hypothetical protein
MNPFKRLVREFFRKEKPKPYEIVPFRTRIRQYVRQIERKSKGKIPYNTLRRRIKEKFEVDLTDLDITNKDARKMLKTKKVAVSAKDIEFEINRRVNGLRGL